VSFLFIFSVMVVLCRRMQKTLVCSEICEKFDEHR